MPATLKKARKLPRSFYARDTLSVARELIGKILVHRDGKIVRAGRIVEVEAYIGEEDKACHARVGRTARTEKLYGIAGHAYVFLIYGMYDCFNVVTERKDFPAAILIRALEPIANTDGRTEGPGRLTRAMHITRAHSGADLCGDNLWIEDRGDRRTIEIAATPRIGIDYAGEWVNKPWRFVDAESAHLSQKLADKKAKVRRG